MKLWTFQAIEAIENLQKNGVLIAEWERYKSKRWKRAYEWIRNQMEKRGIDCHGNAPIWAWHSCGGQFGKAPTLGDASNLLGWLESENSVQTIEFECPDELALLSKYGAWNREVLDYFIIGGEDVILPKTKLDDLFGIHPNMKLEEYESIQATLPYLQLEWVIDIRPLKLGVGENFDFDDDEIV